MNLFLRQQDFLTKNLDVGIGVYNLLNKDFEFIQPYDGGHAPLPDKSREFVVNFNYKFWQSRCINFMEDAKNSGFCLSKSEVTKFRNFQN